MKNVSNYCEVFLEATTRAEIDKLIEEYEKKGFKADKPVRKDADEEHFHYFIFMFIERKHFDGLIWQLFNKSVT